MMLADLLPEAIFSAPPIWLLWPMVVGGIVLLVYGSGRSVNEAVRLAGVRGSSTIAVGATVVSLGTTTPEVLVSVTAAFQGRPGLALGNGVGSIICDTALIFGLCCCLRTLPKDPFILRRHGWVQTGTAVLLVGIAGGLALAHGGIVGVTFPRWAGLIFLVLLVAYQIFALRWARVHPVESDPHLPEPTKASPGPRAILQSLSILAMGLALVILGAQVMVGATSRLCLHYGVPESVLAVTLIAMGTSLPELATGITALVKGHPGLLVGNVIGADILNVLFVIGASATASPLAIPPEFFYLHFPMMLVALGFFRLCASAPGGHFRRWQGVPLLGLFVAYYAVLLLLVLGGQLSMST